MATAAEIIATARSKLGAPYQWGAAGPDRFDCSGLVQWTFARHGIQLPRTTYEQVKVGAEVPRNQIQPGDLVFSTWGSGRRPGHVGIYVGDGKIINAPSAGKPVGYATLTDSYWSHVDAVRRVRLDGSGGGLPLPDLPGPVGGLLDAVQAVGSGVQSLAQHTRAVGDLAGKLMWLALPTTQVRIWTGALGVICLLTGVWMLAREVR